MLSLGERFRLPFILDIRPSAEFHYDAAKAKLIDLRIGSDNGPQLLYLTPGDNVDTRSGADGVGEDVGSRHAQLLRLASWIDMESRTTVSFE